MVKKTVGASILISGLVSLQTSLLNAAPPADPCALLTEAQASAAIGGTLGPGKHLAGALCQWTQQGKAGDVLLKLSIDVITVDHFNRLRSVTLGTVTKVGGLGDDAFYATMKTGAQTNTTLNVKKGDTAVVIRVVGGAKPVDEYQAKEKAVAQAILPKL